jgi:hypothetical protein
MLAISRQNTAALSAIKSDARSFPYAYEFGLDRSRGLQLRTAISQRSIHGHPKIEMACGASAYRLIVRLCTASSLSAPQSEMNMPRTVLYFRLALSGLKERASSAAGVPRQRVREEPHHTINWTASSSTLSPLTTITGTGVFLLCYLATKDWRAVTSSWQHASY